MNNLLHTNLCIMCKTKNAVRYEMSRIRHVSFEIERLVMRATSEEKEVQQEILKNNPYLKSMCEYSKHCSYGLSCQELINDINSINRDNRILAENIVLLGVIDKNKLRYYLQSFQGYYPKAAKYILSL